MIRGDDEDGNLDGVDGLVCLDSRPGVLKPTCFGPGGVLSLLYYNVVGTVRSN